MKSSFYENVAAGLSKNCKDEIKRIRRSRKGVKRSDIPNRTWGALLLRKLVMMNGETVMCTYHGEQIYDVIKCQKE